MDTSKLDLKKEIWTVVDGNHRLQVLTVISV